MNNVQIQYRIEVDTERVNTLLRELDDNNDRKKAIKAALRKSAGIIRKQAKQNLISAIPATKTPGRNGKRYKPLQNEINLAVYRNASGARVDLLDRRKKDSRAYMLKFFEKGTKTRATNKGANRGNINATYFFRDAVDSRKSEAESVLEQNIVDAIRKIQSKKK